MHFLESLSEFCRSMNAQYNSTPIQIWLESDVFISVLADLSQEHPIEWNMPVESKPHITDFILNTPYGSVQILRVPSKWNKSTFPALKNKRKFLAEDLGEE